MNDAARRPELVEVPLLDATAARHWAATVEALSGQWTRRHALAPFFTLGAAAYLDATDGAPAYLDKAAAGNPTLRTAFDALYDALAEALAAHLGAPVRLTARFALPGFHVYLPFWAFAGEVASLHWDRQHALLPWGGPAAPVDDAVLSLTLPLALPEGGAGLRLWPWRHGDGAAARERALADPGPWALHHDYRVGRLVLHDGQHLHQASLMPKRTFGPDDDGTDARITLQAHLARVGDAWELYW